MTGLAFVMALFLFLPASAQFTEETWDFDEEDTTSAVKGKISGGIFHLSYASPFQSDNASWGNFGVTSGTEGEGIPGNWGIDLTVFMRNFALKLGSSYDFVQEYPAAIGVHAHRNTYREIGLGYNIYSKRGLIIYSTANLGLVRNITEFQYNLTDPAPVTNDILGGTAAGTVMKRNSGYAGAEVGLDYMTGYDETAGAGFTFGLRVGYNHQLNSGTWKSFGTEIPDGPDLDISGAYVRLSVGFAGWHRQ